MFTVVILLMAVVTALSHRPSVAIRGILFTIKVAMLTTVTFMFELAVTPLLSVVVPMVGAAASFRRVELMLHGGFLEVSGAKVLLVVEGPM